MRPRFARTHDKRTHSPKLTTRTRHTPPTTQDTTIPSIFTTHICPQQDRLLDRLATDTGRSDSSAQSMPLTIKPPRPPSEPTAASSQPSSSNDGSSSPVAPAYSPITPKVQPALPAIGHTQHGFEVPSIPPTNAIPDMMMHDDRPPEQPYDHHSQPSHPFTGGKAPIPPPAPPPAPSAISETEYIPEPPPQPFSSEDSADAVALRAAISSLQFQKQKAKSDLQVLEGLKKKALEDPQRYKRELLAGTLKEQRPNFGSIRDVLDAPEEEGDDDDEVVLGASDSPASRAGANHDHSSSEVSPTNQPAGKDAPFGQIPGPQTVVRMPPINWDKYHVVGESLDALHEQQRRWPGSTPGQGDRGREHSVAAPYSPFYDTLDSPAQQQHRNDSHASALGTSFGSTSEHPMETRRTSRN
jgi:hypothetical protein